MRDIIVTTPRREMETAAEEARGCIESGGGYYFRTFHHLPKDIEVGSRVFYVEDGYVRGYALVNEINRGDMRCGTTGRVWDGNHVIMLANSWTWVRPIPMRGFQGWRYYEPPADLKVVGDWLDPKPEVI